MNVNYVLIFAVLIFVLAGHSALAQEQSPGIWRIASGDYQDIDAYGVEAIVVNEHASGADIMVPAGTAEQWNGFRNNLPDGVWLGDRVPDIFNFINSIALLGSLTKSSVIAVAGINMETPISISGDGSPQYRICADAICSVVNHDWSDEAGLVLPDEYVQLRLDAASGLFATRTATVNIGGVADNWSVTSVLTI